MPKIYRANVWYVRKQWNRTGGFMIVPGWRAEVIDGLDDNTMVYTGAKESRAAALADLAQQLKSRGLTGILRVA